MFRDFVASFCKVSVDALLLAVETLFVTSLFRGLCRPRVVAIFLPEGPLARLLLKIDDVNGLDSLTTVLLLVEDPLTVGDFVFVKFVFVLDSCDTGATD